MNCTSPETVFDASGADIWRLNFAGLQVGQLQLLDLRASWNSQL